MAKAANQIAYVKKFKAILAQLYRFMTILLFVQRA